MNLIHVFIHYNLSPYRELLRCNDPNSINMTIDVLTTAQICIDTSPYHSKWNN